MHQNSSIETKKNCSADRFPLVSLPKERNEFFLLQPPPEGNNSRSYILVIMRLSLSSLSLFNPSVMYKLSFQTFAYKLVAVHIEAL